jgi:hypothetical protein
MDKCGNKSDPALFTGHRWIVDNIIFCSPWCQRNKGKHPNSVGAFKGIGRKSARNVDSDRQT